jgi:hypothetical protein
MKAQINTGRVFPWFDVAGVVVDSSLLTAKLYLGATVVKSFAVLSNLAEFADAYVTERYAVQAVGTYSLVILYDGTAVDSVQVTVSHVVVPDMQYGLSVAPGLGISQYMAGADMAVCCVYPDGTVSSTINVTYQAAMGAYVADSAIAFTQRGACQLVWKAVVSAVEVPVLLQDVWAGTSPGYENATFIARTADAADSTKHVGTTVVVSDADAVQLAQGVTGSDGAVTLPVYPGTVVVSLLKDGIVYSTNNFTCVIVDTQYSPDDENVYPLVTTAFAPTATPTPTPAPMCTLWATLLQANGNALRHADIKVHVLSYPILASGACVTGTTFSCKTDSNGYVSFDIVQGAVLEVAIPAASLRRIVTVPSGAAAVDPVNLLLLVNAALDVMTAQSISPPAAPRRALHV